MTSRSDKYCLKHLNSGKYLIARHGLCMMVGETENLRNYGYWTREEVSSGNGNNQTYHLFYFNIEEDADYQLATEEPKEYDRIVGFIGPNIELSTIKIPADSTIDQATSDPIDIDYLDAAENQVVCYDNLSNSRYYHGKLWEFKDGVLTPALETGAPRNLSMRDIFRFPDITDFQFRDGLAIFSPNKSSIPNNPYGLAKNSSEPDRWAFVEY
ncbi:hypothetical protein ACIPZ5_04860 [Pseudomonas sp. NPDC089428]|uniref:hypothetical protein n=1 Tax=Pseudomonas sp. NPDC089428 TaxID=3364467 RepID=UPI0037F620D3